MTRIAQGLVVLAMVTGAADAARAEPVSPEIGAAAAPFEPSFYLAGMVATTMAYRPPGGEVAGPQSDLTPMAGVGLLVRPDLALELDAGPTMVDGEYVAFALMPGAVWLFDPHVYAAARVSVVVDPEPNLALLPGLGLTHAFDSGLAPFVEANLFSYVGRGDPDLGASLTVGATFTP
jgi:hypothetical protein